MYNFTLSLHNILNFAALPGLGWLRNVNPVNLKDYLPFEANCDAWNMCTLAKEANPKMRQKYESGHLSLTCFDPLFKLLGLLANHSTIVQTLVRPQHDG